MYQTVINGTNVTIEEIEGGIVSTAISPFEPHNKIRRFIATKNIPPNIVKLLEKAANKLEIPELDSIESLEVGEPVLRKKLKRG